MMRRADFKGLRSLSDVKTERMRIEMEIDRAKELLTSDYERIDSYFTVAFYVNKFKEKMISFYSIAESVRKGYDTVITMIQQFRKNHESRGKKIEEELISDAKSTPPDQQHEESIRA